MKIIGHSIFPVTFPLKRPIGDAREPFMGNRGAYLILRLNTDEGNEGFGCATILARPYLEDLINRFIIGSDPHQVEGLWEALASACGEQLHQQRGLSPAMAVIDIAIWDLKAQASEKPLWKLLGGSFPEIPIYASGLDMGISDEALRAFYLEQAANGIHVGKLKVNHDGQNNLRRFHLMQDALATSGCEPLIAVDANQTWTFHQAVERIRELEDVAELAWVEEPLPFHDLEGMQRLAKRVKSPILSGENLRTVDQFKQLIDAQISDTIQITPLTLGGFTPTLQVAELAATRNNRISLINTPGSIAAPIAVALPNCEQMEYCDLGRADAFGWSFEIEDGRLRLTNEPGLGMKPSLQALALPQLKKDYEGIEFFQA